MGDDRDAVMPGREEHVEEAADPRPVGGSPEAIAGLGKAVVRMLDAGQMSEEHAVRVQGSLGLAGGAGGVDDDGRVLGSGVDGLEASGGTLERGVEIESSRDSSIGAEHGA